MFSRTIFDKVMDNQMVTSRTVKSIQTAACIGVFVSFTIAGCASRGGIFGVDECADIPKGAIPHPAGKKLCDWQTAQINGAIGDQTVLYRADFIGKGSALSPGAIERMARNANTGLAATQASLIEPSGDESLDAARLGVVIDQLASLGITEPIVEIATPAAIGLRGPQAERVASGLGSRRNQSRGTGAPIAGRSGLGGQSSGFGGFGGSGGNLSGGIF